MTVPPPAEKSEVERDASAGGVNIILKIVSREVMHRAVRVCHRCGLGNNLPNIWLPFGLTPYNYNSCIPHLQPSQLTLRQIVASIPEAEPKVQVAECVAGDATGPQPLSADGVHRNSTPPGRKQ